MKNKLIKNLFKNKDLKYFILKFSILAILFLIFYFLGQYNTEKEIIMPEYIEYDEIAHILVFSAIAFFLLAKDRLKNIKNFKTDLKQTLIFALSTIAVFILFKKFTEFSLAKKALEYYWPMLVLKYLIPLIFILFLILTVFNLEFIKDFYNKFNKLIFSALGLGIIFKYLTLAFQQSNLFFSNAVAKAVLFLLNINIKEAFLKYKIGYPILVTPAFESMLDKPCSGIEGLALFLGLFMIAWLMDYKIIVKTKALIAIPLGLMGSFILNIFRVYILFLIGIFISPSFAVGFFHSNVGWVLFVLYFLIFEYFVHDWLRKKWK